MACNPFPFHSFSFLAEVKYEYGTDEYKDDACPQRQGLFKKKSRNQPSGILSNMYTPRKSACPGDISRIFTPSLLRVLMSSIVFCARVRLVREKHRTPLLMFEFAQLKLIADWFRRRGDVKDGAWDGARDRH